MKSVDQARSLAHDIVARATAAGADGADAVVSSHASLNVSVRLGQLEDVLSGREWLAAGRFTVADLLMADVLRVPDVRAFGRRPASEAYVARLTDRPAFKKAQADQIALFATADETRAAKGPGQRAS